MSLDRLQTLDFLSEERHSNCVCGWGQGEHRCVQRYGANAYDQKQAMAEETAEFVYDYISMLNVPQTLQDTGIERYQLPIIAENMLKSKAVQSNPKPVETVDDAMSLLEAAW